ncbi:pre-mRNA-splicing factor 38A-like [Daphnia pulex]|uniref:pre-mRNA-splicing factor 38A-like n=1 Tax=Daphnia pulex TaxID=6669 RepID=UPI001EDC9C1A|nr:pre-mRNA-splicing factor 38A-like [Daphnia pulex]
MANRTIKEAISVKGTNPQYLVEKIIRTRIYDSKYWKEECFALTAELMVDKAMELRYIGGIFGGNVKPTPFLSLTLKMLQIQPEKDIVVEFIKNEDFKYVRALGAFYMRLVGTSVEIYKYLEPLYNDYRKIRFQNKEGNFELLYMDDFIDSLLREERFCDVILPRLQKRQILEEANEVEPRVSALEEDLEEEDSESEEEEGERKGGSLSPPPTTSRSKQDSDRERERSRRNRDKERERERSRERRDRHRDRSRSRDKRNRSRERDRDRSRERERDRSRRQRSRSVERSRDYRRDQDRDRRDRKDRGKDRESERDRSKRGEDRDKYNNKKKDSKKSSSSSAAIDPEIAEANALRAKLGLAPLRP